MCKLVESVPNISEGQDENIIRAIADAVSSTPGATLMHVQSDIAHNRSVFSILGTPEAVEEAVFRLSKEAASRIDLRRQRGEHPRMGAVDVIPFIPIRNTDIQDCIALSERVAERLWKELSIPVYLYEHSAKAPNRRNLAKVREGQFEGLRDKMRSPEWAPDYGALAPHPSAGAVAVGAREPLIAFNIDLDTDNIEIAKAIAKTIRESSGGLPSVKALGIMLSDRDTAQVSINMTDHKKTPLHQVVELVKIEAARYGVSVRSTEIVGLAPMNALLDSAIYYLMLDGFSKEKQVLENHLN